MLDKILKITTNKNSTSHIFWQVLYGVIGSFMHPFMLWLENTQKFEPISD